jgi:hypothetical protein
VLASFLMVLKYIGIPCLVALIAAEVLLRFTKEDN